MYVVPPGVSSIPDSASRYYTILRYGIGRDVSLITTANPSSTIKLIETGQQHVERLIRDVADGTLNPPADIPAELGLRPKFKPNRALARRLEEGVRRDGKLMPRHFWNLELLLNWTGGTLYLYMQHLREMFDNAPVRDIGLLASEGRFSLPMADMTAAGVAEITGNFLEFIPAEKRGEPNPPVLRADELEVGREYVLVFSNWTGFWRYNMDDCVKVVDRYGQSPVFEFLNRGTSTASITGEKLTEHQVVLAMRQAAASVGQDVDRFYLEGHFAKPPYYQLQLEAVAPETATRLAAAFDDALAEINLEYKSKRTSDRLGQVQPLVLPEGAMEQTECRQIQLRRGRPEQYKHQYLRTNVVADE
ncbi:MAG: hypothetical protein EHM48_06020 [Planctomycetaceae bacterium]|nr:MAG: hypothetical protein EHM48_06020 [Planctomycetaceae bacterium]